MAVALFLTTCFRVRCDVACLCRTRRAWKVNHQWKHLYSEALDEKVGLNVTTHTLRCVDKAGGLDNYLLSLKKESDLGVKGLKARDRIVEALANASSAAEGVEAAQ